LATPAGIWVFDVAFDRALDVGPVHSRPTLLAGPMARVDLVVIAVLDHVSVPTRRVASECETSVTEQLVNLLYVLGHTTGHELVVLEVDIDMRLRLSISTHAYY
jgi:hypothetical protein